MVEATQPPTHPAESYVSEELTLIWLLLITTVVITYFVQRHRLTWIPPSSCAMILGVLAGVVMRVAGLAQQPLRFSPSTFFYALLPPIVFAAGFTLKKRQFFKNFLSILLFAVVGTFISAIVFGGCTYLLVLMGVVRRAHLAGSPLVECLAYGAAISSIDPVATLAVLNELEVPPLLYNLVFGESVLNDAVAIVLFRSLVQFSGQAFGWKTLPQLALHFVVLSLGSLVVGAGIALLCAFILKRFYRPRDEGRGSHEVQHSDGTLYEIAIVVMGAYLAYLVAEVVGMSGVVALFFSGICHAHYSCYNVSLEAQVTLRKSFDFAAFMCEQFVFVYLGIQVVTMQHSWDIGLLVSGIPLCVLSRAANIFPCSYLANLGRTYPIPLNLQKMLWAVGLRGAVAYGLVINLPRADNPQETGIPAIETATLFIVVVTTLVLGSATGPLLRRFDLEGKDDAALYGMALSEGGLTHGINPGRPVNRIEFSERSTLLDQFKTFDAAFLKPLFGGRIEGSEELGHLFAGNRSETARSYASLSYGEEGNGGEGYYDHSRLASPTFTRQAPGEYAVQIQNPDGPSISQAPQYPRAPPGADAPAEVQLQSVGHTQDGGDQEKDKPI